MNSGISRRHLIFMAAGLGISIVTRPVIANPLPTPQGKPILRVGGEISVRNRGNEAVFDIAMLDALGTSSFLTSTPWTDGVSEWEGVRLETLMEAVGASGDTLRATALNDYVADVPLADVAKEQALLAMRRDGELMPINDKGPLFILYPFDGNPSLQQQNVYMRCAWHVARLDVL